MFPSENKMAKIQNVGVNLLIMIYIFNSITDGKMLFFQYSHSVLSKVAWYTILKLIKTNDFIWQKNVNLIL